MLTKHPVFVEGYPRIRPQRPGASVSGSLDPKNRIARSRKLNRSIPSLGSGDPGTLYSGCLNITVGLYKCCSRTVVLLLLISALSICPSLCPRFGQIKGLDSGKSNPSIRASLRHGVGQVCTTFFPGLFLRIAGVFLRIAGEIKENQYDIP